MGGRIRAVGLPVLVAIAAMTLLVLTKNRAPESMAEGERNLTYVVGTIALIFSFARIVFWVRAGRQNQ